MKKLLGKLLKGDATMPKTAKKPAQQPRPPAPAGRITLDHPAENETIGKSHYAVRITTSDCERVEISIDGGGWTPCRNSAGHWWHDLYGLNAGEHKLAARMHNAGAAASAARKFKVE